MSESKLGGVYCCVDGCENKVNNTRFSFFRIGLPDLHEKRKGWFTRIGREDLFLKKNAGSFRVCSVHFEPRMFTKKRLAPDAHPTLRLPNRHASKSTDKADDMKSCAVFGCKSTSQLEKFLLFHQFPCNAARCNSWKEACRNVDLASKSDEELSNLHICSMHFERTMYVGEQLRPGATPSANMPVVITAFPTPTPTTPPVETLHIKIEEPDDDEESDDKNEIEEQTSTCKQMVRIVRRYTIGVQTDPVYVVDKENLTEDLEAKKIKLEDEEEEDITEEEITEDLEAKKIKLEDDHTQEDITEEESTEDLEAKKIKLEDDHTQEDVTEEESTEDLEAKKIKLECDHTQEDVTEEEFSQLCDRFLPPMLSHFCKSKLKG